MRCLSGVRSASNRSSRNSKREYGRPLSMPHLMGKPMKRTMTLRKRS
jgi:hypothetical protein